MTLVTQLPRGGEKPFDARFRASDRYTPAKQAHFTAAVVDGPTYAAEVLGRNGPRVQVRVHRDGQRFVRWLDADALVDPVPPEAA